MTNLKLIDEYQKYENIHKTNDIVDNLKQFLQFKKVYSTDSTIENRINMKIAYDKIYHNTKELMVSHIISNQRFWELVDCLQDYDMK